MWKVVLLVAVLTIVYLFVPRYDLLAKKGDNSNDYELAEKGFWRVQSCRDAGAQYKNGFRCQKYSLWVRMMGQQHQMNTMREVE